MFQAHRSVKTVAVVAVLAMPLAAASIAFACARLATLKLDSASAAPGGKVSAIGRNFNNDSRSSPVALRFNSRNGRVLWEGRADRRGIVRGTFRVPEARRGDYVIVATQQTAEGRPAAGTPGRAPLRVRGGSRSAAAAAAPVTVGGSSGGGLPVAAAALVPLLMLLSAGAAALLAGRRRLALSPARR